MTRLLPLLLLAACGADVPANPTYFADVQQILRANCSRCHGADPITPAIAKYRLDRYVKLDDATLDAFDYADSIVMHAVDHVAPAMPPDYVLSDRQREILARWFAAGAPKGSRSNSDPQIELISPQGTTTADQSLDIVFRSWDTDLDGIAVQLWAHDVATGEDVPLGAQTGGGTRALAIDTGTLASKHSFEIYAVLDDGFADEPAANKRSVTLIPRVDVDHGARGTAPTVRLVAPNGGSTLIGSATITWTATDPDVDGGGAPDTLTIDLALVRLAPDGTELGVEPIASNLPNTGSFMWTIPSTVAARDGSGPIPYRVRVTATDSLGVPPNVRSDDSDLPFFVEQATTTTLTWNDIEPLMTKYCAECHSQPAKSPALDPYCLVEYEKGEAVPPCEADDIGVFEMRNEVYSRVVTLANMPPATSPKPTQAERDMIASWILGGAPYGSGPTNARPTLTWISPGTVVLDASGTGVAPLEWTDADAEALKSDAIEYTKVTGPPSCNLSGGGCATLMMATWKPVTTGTVTGTSQARMFDWPLPPEGAGCYCVRGTVTDDANQTTTVVAAKPVRF